MATMYDIVKGWDHKAAGWLEAADDLWYWDCDIDEEDFPALKKAVADDEEESKNPGVQSVLDGLSNLSDDAQGILKQALSRADMLGECWKDEPKYWPKEGEA